MPLGVTDVRSNPNDQIAHAVKILGRSKDKLKVFLAIHSGKSKVKSVSELVRITKLSRKRVLEDAKRLEHASLVSPARKNGEIAYARDSFYYAKKQTILRLIGDPAKRATFPTKYNPGTAKSVLIIRAPAKLVHTVAITVDDIRSFRKVRSVRVPLSASTLKEQTIKKGFQRILGERGAFKDWGGEQSDLISSRMVLKSSRIRCAIAFKGRATRGTLTPAKLGKNGDQIQRLFSEDAEVFLVQYHGRIAGSVLQQMAVHAQAKSLSTGKRIFYGVIDGTDTGRLLAAYRTAFR